MDPADHLGQGTGKDHDLPSCLPDPGDQLSAHPKHSQALSDGRQGYRAEGEVGLIHRKRLPVGRQAISPSPRVKPEAFQHKGWDLYVDYHRPLPPGLDLATIFCLEEDRTVSNHWVIRYHHRLCQILPQFTRPPAKQRLTVQEQLDGTIRLV